MNPLAAITVALCTLLPCLSSGVIAWTLQPPAQPATVELPPDVELIPLPTAPTTEPEPIGRVASYAAQEYYGFIFAENNPNVGHRLLFLARSGISRHNPTANLAFAVDDQATYERCVGYLDKAVHLYGVPVDRGGATWVLVQEVKRMN